MVEVKVESIRVSLINQQRLVVLREVDSERYLAIWIGAFEAEAITMGLQNTDVQRPLTHDLLRNAIDKLGATIERVVVSSLREETFFATIVLDADGKAVEIDARSSDAIALAVRVDVPIMIDDDVMEHAGQLPSEGEEIGDEEDEDEDENGGGRAKRRKRTKEAGAAAEESSDLSVFRDFFDSLDPGGAAGGSGEESSD